MKVFSINIKLLIVFVILLSGFFIVFFGFTRKVQFSCIAEMGKAAEKAQKWFDIIQKEKDIWGIHSDAGSNVPNNFMLGDDFSFMTTTLGSLNAKEISTNPDFAALMVRLLEEAGIKKGDKAGLVISGSFPALAISTMAALNELGIHAILISSLGASTYGANQEEATWIDMESWLIQDGGFPFRSVLVSAGAENDSGGGLQAEGLSAIRKAVGRNNRELYTPDGLLDAIHTKESLLLSEKIKVLINIGGNQVALGGCPHASGLPNGLHKHLKLCNHPDRGLIQDLNAKGIPVINLLNLRELASRYGMDLAPGVTYAPSVNLYQQRESNPIAVTTVLLIGLIAIIFLLKKNSLQNEKMF